MPICGTNNIDETLSSREYGITKHLVLTFLVNLEDRVRPERWSGEEYWG